MAPMTTYRRGELEFDVVDTGPEDGEAVVLLHGFPQSAAEWEGVTARLNAAGLRTVAPNQRGYSPGARPRGRFAYRMSELVEDVAALVDTLGRGPVHLVGHDWGAAISWLVAAKHRDRVRTLTALSVSHPGAFRRALLSSRQVLLSWYMAAFQLPFLPELALDPSRGGQGRFVKALTASGQSREAAERDAGFFKEPGTFSAALNWYRAIPFADQRMGGQVSVPTTFVWSDGDGALLRPDRERVAEYVDAPFRYHELVGVSHWIPDEVPDQVAEMVLAHAR